MTEIHCTPPALPIAKLKHMAELGWYVLQIRNIGHGKPVKFVSNALKDLAIYISMSQRDAAIKKIMRY